MKTKDFLDNLETNTAYEIGTVLAKNEEGKLEARQIDLRGLDFEKVSIENPDLTFGVLEGKEGDLELKAYSDGKEIFGGVEGDFERSDELIEYFQAIVEYGTPDPETKEYVEMQEKFGLTEKVVVEDENGEKTFFKNEKDAQEYMNVEKHFHGAESKVYKTLEPVSEKSFMDVEAVLESKEELILEQYESLNDDKVYYEEEKEKLSDQYNKEEFEYIRETYENGDEDTKEYLLSADPDFKAVVEGLQMVDEKIDETNDKIEVIKGENKDIVDRNVDSVESNVEDSQDSPDVVEDVDDDVADDAQEDFDDFDDDVEGE